jgi:hypothetical protein
MRQVSHQRNPTITSRKEVGTAAKKIPFSLSHPPFIYSLPFQLPPREDLKKLTTEGRHAINQH